MSDEIGTKLLLSLQRALTGNVVWPLRGVTCAWSEKQVTIRYLLHGAISEDDRDTCTTIGSEVAADLPDGWMVDDEIVRYDAPQPLEDMALSAWAYRRKEPD